MPAKLEIDKWVSDGPSCLNAMKAPLCQEMVLCHPLFLKGTFHIHLCHSYWDNNFLFLMVILNRSSTPHFKVLIKLLMIRQHLLFLMYRTGRPSVLLHLYPAARHVKLRKEIIFVNYVIHSLLIQRPTFWLC